MSRWLSRIVWGAIQLGIGVVCFIAIKENAAEKGEPFPFGVAVLLAILVPITFTVVCALIADGAKRLWWSLTGRNQPHIREPGSEHERLSAPGRGAGETLEFPRRPRIGKEPR